MKHISFLPEILLTVLFLLIGGTAWGKEFLLSSPNAKIEVNLRQTDAKSWYLSLYYNGLNGKSEVFSAVNLGLERQDASFRQHLKLEKLGKKRFFREEYVVLHGKRKNRMNEANERTLYFRNSSGQRMNVIIRAYNDGVCFRYEFPDPAADRAVMKEEYTSYEVSSGTDRWMQRFIANYEGDYPHQKEQIEQGEWGYPSLFKSDGKACWALVSEADIDRNYCATKLTNSDLPNTYKLAYPAESDGGAWGGAVCPVISLPWKSPWRVMIIGQLNDIVESTLVEDVSTPSKLVNTDWIKPGMSSWVYWAYNHGTKDYKRLCEYVDLAVEMNWPYTLIDWEWDEMANGGNVEDIVTYARSKGIKPMIWYNSSTSWTGPGPLFRLNKKEDRLKEFAWLKKLGIYGVKVDFFDSDKQNMMNYYLDILEDAAACELMVNFHGCTVPRGWSRTYPHLMSMEAVHGAEQYNNASRMTEIAARLNTTLPFTRNVIGPMDYTPVTFTDSQHKHITSNAHELALSVIFESGLQHMADRPQGFYDLPVEAKDFLRLLPVAWDRSYLMDGYPGEKVLMRREKGDTIYVAGINGTDREEAFSLPFDFLPEGVSYQLLLIADGKKERELNVSRSVVRKNTLLPLSWLPRGGFSARLTVLK